MTRAVGGASSGLRRLPAAVAAVFAVAAPLSGSPAVRAPADADDGGGRRRGRWRPPAGSGDTVCGDVRFDRSQLPGRTATPANGDWPTAAAADLLRLRGWPRAVPFDVAHWTVVRRGTSGVLVAFLPGTGFGYLRSTGRQAEAGRSGRRARRADAQPSPRVEASSTATADGGRVRVRRDDEFTAYVAARARLLRRSASCCAGLAPGGGPDPVRAHQGLPRVVEGAPGRQRRRVRPAGPGPYLPGRAAAAVAQRAGDRRDARRAAAGPGRGQRPADGPAAGAGDTAGPATRGGGAALLGGHADHRGGPGARLQRGHREEPDVAGAGRTARRLAPGRYDGFREGASR